MDVLTIVMIGAALMSGLLPAVLLIGASRRGDPERRITEHQLAEDDEQMRVLADWPHAQQPTVPSQPHTLR